MLHTITKKSKSILLLILLIIALLITTSLLYSSNIIPHKKYSNEDFNIPTYNSLSDQDQDGMDDQSDILQNVKEYIAKKPKYKSKYYATGYSNDEYGVCTDVVAIGLKHAGYDLMQLVHEHIQNNPNLYQIECIDQNIDFRRVKNLKVYFDHNATSLTTDITKIDQWQGGDIVVFSNHIGIVSNHRNKKGICFIIHHANPFQLHYEKDILEHRNDIIGHYRMP